MRHILHHLFSGHGFSSSNKWLNVCSSWSALQWESGLYQASYHENRLSQDSQTQFLNQKDSDNYLNICNAYLRAAFLFISALMFCSLHNKCLPKENFMAMQVKIPLHVQLIQREVSTVFFWRTWNYIFLLYTWCIPLTTLPSSTVTMRFAHRLPAQIDCQKQRSFSFVTSCFSSTTSELICEHALS